MDVCYATREDIPGWMSLVETVKDYFPGLDKSSYQEVLSKNIQRKTALCVRQNGLVIGALLFSPKESRLSFIAVHHAFRRLGIAESLIGKMLTLLPEDKDISVTTFRRDDKKGASARGLYEKYGFEEAELLHEYGYPLQKLILRRNCQLNEKL